MAERIERLEEVLVYSDKGNPWVTLYFDRVKFVNGDIGRYNRIVEGSGVPGVAVLPVSALGIGLVRQYRYAVEMEVWEIPRGYGDSADSPREAERELLEETGLRALQMVSLGLVHPNSSVCTTRIELFLARCDVHFDASPKTGSEQTEFKWFSIAEAMGVAERCEVMDSISLSALFRARLRGLI